MLVGMRFDFQQRNLFLTQHSTQNSPLIGFWAIPGGDFRPTTEVKSHLSVVSLEPQLRVGMKVWAAMNEYWHWGARIAYISTLLEILLEFTCTKNTTLNFFTKREVSVEIDFERVLFIFGSLLIISAISPRWCPVQELSLKTAPPLCSLPQTFLNMRVEDTTKDSTSLNILCLYDWNEAWLIRCT